VSALGLLECAVQRRDVGRFIDDVEQRLAAVAGHRGNLPLRKQTDRETLGMDGLARRDHPLTIFTTLLDHIALTVRSPAQAVRNTIADQFDADFGVLA